MHELPDDLAAAVSGIEVVTRSLGEGQVEYIHKIKLADKRGPLELLGKHLKMFTDKVDLNHGADDSVAALMKAIATHPKDRNKP